MLKQPATEDLVGAPLRTPIIHRLYQDLIQPFIGKWQAFWHTPPLRMASPHCRILLTAGVNRLGQNIGDDAQLARTLHCWKQVAPDAKLNVMTLDPEGLARLHPSVQAVPAPRKAFFSAHRFYSGYGSGRLLFRIRFAFIAPWLGLNARLWRAGLPIIGL